MTIRGNTGEVGLELRGEARCEPRRKDKIPEVTCTKMRVERDVRESHERAHAREQTATCALYITHKSRAGKRKWWVAKWAVFRRPSSTYPPIVYEIERGKIAARSHRRSYVVALGGLKPPQILPDSWLKDRLSIMISILK